jgi:hypothetical protein
MYVELDTLAELSLALIGFSALIAMFRGGSVHTWEPRPRVGFWIIVSYSLGALVFALLPSILRDLNVDSWALPVALLALFHLITMSLLLRRHLRLNSAGHPTPNPLLWVIGALMGFGTSALLFVGMAGGLGGPTYRLYHVGVASCLLVASVSFVGVLRLHRPAA